MIQLRRIKLTNFKRFRNLEKEFVSGVNVVSGPLNEMGKSTLVEAIMVALFENPKSTRKEIGELVSWGATKRPRIEMEFEAGPKRYLLEKDFETKSARLRSLDSDDEWNTPQQVGEKLAELVGTASAELFRATTTIRQDEMAWVNSRAKEISKHLEEIITGGTEDVTTSQIIDRLDQKIAEMERGLGGLAKRPGEIARLKEEIRTREQELTRIKTDVEKLEKCRLDKVKALEKLEAVKGQIEEIEKLLEQNKKLQEVEREIEQAQKQYNDSFTLMTKIKTLEQKLSETTSRMERFYCFEEGGKLSALEEHLRNLEQKRKDIETDLAKRENELNQKKLLFAKHRTRNLLASWATLVGGAAIILAGIGAATINLAWLGLSGVGVTLVITSLWARLSLTREHTEIETLERRIADMNTAFDALGQEEQGLLAQGGFASLDDFHSQAEERQRLNEEQKELQVTLRTLLSGRTVSDIERDCEEAARTLHEAKSNLTAEMEMIKLTPEEFIRYERKLDKLQSEYKEQEKIIAECQFAIEHTSYDIETQHQKEEELEELERELNRKDRRLKLLKTTKYFLERARRETLSDSAEPLREALEHNLKSFTDGKYSRATIAQDSLDIQVYSPEKNDWVAPENLSGGTRDEVYLACRLALADILFGNKYPPLILDDPLLDFDVNRRQKTLEFISRLADRQQVIICTKEDCYNPIANRIIDLGD